MAGLEQLCLNTTVFLSCEMKSCLLKLNSNVPFQKLLKFLSVLFINLGRQNFPSQVECLMSGQVKSPSPP